MADGPVFDIFIIGGGVNGCGIARDAVGRGLSVFLAEASDLASGTSSGSTKLIHGGLRYLEYYEFRLVREALVEREVIWRNAPHIVRPMRFVLPHHRGLRPAWLLRLGLFLYDHIGGRRLLPATKTLDMRRDPAGKPLKASYSRAFEYSDCRVDDARLVVLNARDAADRGAAIATRTRARAARREGGHWSVEVEDARSGARRTVRAKMLVNAAGPWIDHVLAAALGRRDARNVRLVQGSHIVVRKKFDDPRAYFFQNADGRIVFAIPYEDDFTLIGTTDRDFDGDPRDAAITDAETDYLCAAASEYFSDPVRREDVVWTYAAVRPLYDDGASKAQEATRDYVLKVEGGAGEPPLLNVFGGKITTYRRLAEHAVEKIEAALGRAAGRGWTADAPLPGGDFAPDGVEAEVARLRARHAFLAAGHARRLVRLYGTRAAVLLEDARSLADLGRCFGADLYEAEVRYLMAQEWAATADDVLWRRTKLGLRVCAEEAAALDAFMQAA
ncbi:MAG: glycerol-3-phosphate dehydrogenase [Hyphomicrobiales bacterium]|nr:MAG: glycerol-3-phosphate dehydrogenase [Hyphomicrobiales bacterium]